MTREVVERVALLELEQFRLGEGKGGGVRDSHSLHAVAIEMPRMRKARAEKH